MTNRIEVGKTYTTAMGLYICRWVDGEFAYMTHAPGKPAHAWYLDGGAASLDHYYDVIWAGTPITREITYSAPETVAPGIGEKYWRPDPASANKARVYMWLNDVDDSFWLARGLVYLNEADAVARAEAMLK